MSEIQWVAADESVDSKMVAFLNFLCGPRFRLMTHFFYLDGDEDPPVLEPYVAAQRWEKSDYYPANHWTSP